jgi:hypothetical protein
MPIQKFTRRQYEAIAGVIRELDESGISSDVEEFAAAMVDMFACDNPNFDAERFIAACGMR